MSDAPPPPNHSSAPPIPRAVVRVVLLGYMTAGKSTVGQALARRLEWRFLDFDVEIERREGRTIGDLVQGDGQSALREMEAALTEEVAETPYLVLAPGGGWITRPELLRRLGGDTLAVWLKVSPEETARRLKMDTIERPFRELDDPVPRIAEMIEAREDLYRLADISIPTDGRSVESIAYEIETIVRMRALAAFAPPAQA
ncbi:shikimate kinase [Longimicrobium sp.]|uniref:shikimate kinase n=1 Tax=Longimicrobium sp. TaxID=2029185 RepID=UPI002C04AFF4|nr:shikimate kinase [Longimicrobium sp.]HSU15980.1 shikimate kinase [Longimicrobium sp.]